MDFWDFCAPFYDLGAKANKRAYREMLHIVRELVPPDASVLEAAAGTGAISLAVADKASHVLCTDLSDNMLKKAQKKAAKRKASNVIIANRSIYDLGQPDSSYDVVVAAQVLNLLDEPEKAAAELRRIAKSLVILPTPYIKNLRGPGRINIRIFKLLGFSPKFEFDRELFARFLPSVGFNDCKFIQIQGKVPLGIAIWTKT
ncbi:MAG: class I SAM-dependent methyltransferase [Oscillospiraceae bacterium]|nr:class I SAM-dependent methyltransferase [Oscillospiraceae bacterium]